MLRAIKYELNPTKIQREQGDEFDSDELQDALYEEISNDIMCEYNRFSFIVKL